MLGRGRSRILGVLLLLACGGGGTTAPGSVTVAVAPERTLLVQLGATVRFTATVTGGSSGTLEWSSSDPAIATVTDGLARAVSPGAVTITASSGDASASADLEVYIAEALDEITPGGRHFGRAGYAEFLVGDLPLVLSSPHGGELLRWTNVTDNIPDLPKWGTVSNIEPSTTASPTLRLRPDAPFPTCSGSRPGHTALFHGRLQHGLEDQLLQPILAEGDSKSFRYPNRLYSQLSFLIGNLGASVDFAPNAQQREVQQVLRARLIQFQAEFEALLENDVAAFNRLVRGRLIT